MEDITNFVESFSLLTKTEIKPIKSNEGYTYSFDCSSPVINIDMTLDAEKTSAHIWDGMEKKVVKMSNRGKFWFDKSFDADVVMTDLVINKDGSCDAIYNSINIVDTTEKGLVARFLRWLLKRN